MGKYRKRFKKKAISEIKKYQTGKHAVTNLIPKSCFNRLARNMAHKESYGIRFRNDAIEGLQQATESYLVQILAKANSICISGKRETLSANDIRLALSIAEDRDFEHKQNVFQPAEEEVQMEPGELEEGEPQEPEEEEEPGEEEEEEEEPEEEEEVYENVMGQIV
jgi:histone H3/H4